MGNLNIQKEFEELPSIYQFPIELQGIVLRIQKDAWNAAIKWCADNAKVTRESTEHITGYLTAEFVVDKQSILNGLIDD